jgi:sugar phosphate isomerase/epimerase
VTEKLRSTLDNPDMQAAPQALRRAARRAREIARRTGTRLVVVHGGVLRELDPDSPELQSADDESLPKSD